MTLRFKTWVKRYKPLRDELGLVRSFETYVKEDIDFIKQQNPLCVWTEISSDDNRVDVIVSGCRIVNRISYFVTEIPFEEGEYVEVYSPY